MKKVKMQIWSYGGMILIGSLIMSLTLATTVLSAPVKEVPPFKIGIVTSLSGAAYGYGQRAVIGARYKIEEEINKAGGINGHPVKLFIYDTNTRADQAAMLTERAATVDKVFAILGANSSSDTAATFPTANRLGVPDFSFSGTLRGLVEKNLPWAFAAHLSDDFWGEPLSLVIDKFNVKTMVLMGDAKYNFSLSQCEWGYKIAARKGVKVLHDKGKLDVETGWADFTPQVTQIKSLAPDLIASILFPPDLGHLAIAIKGAGIDAKVKPCFGFGAVMPDFIVAGGAATEYWYGTGDFDAGSTDPLQKAWVEKLTAYGKSITTDPGLYTVQNNTSGGYIAAAFICEAIKRTKITPDTSLQEARLKIRDELPKIKMKVYSSEELRLGEGGRYEKNRIVGPVFLFQVRDGKLITVGEVR